MRFRNRFLWAFVIILLILVLTNPNLTQFKNFSSGIPVQNRTTNFKRVINGIIFSIYLKEEAFTFEKGRNKIIGHVQTTKYFGIFSNFIKTSTNIVPDGVTHLK